jgi:hypothetical protein
MKPAISNRIIALLIAIITASIAYSQNTISGKVMSASGGAISGASVTSGTRGTQTTADGSY